MFRCPVCRELGVTLYDKFYTSALFPAECKNCGTRLRFHRLYYLGVCLLVNGLIFTGIFLFLGGYAIGLVGVVGGLLLLVVLVSLHLLVPLVPKDPALRKKVKNP